MAWTDIPDTDVDQDSPVTVALMTALRDNPIAISDSDPGAPINETGWHPYNRSINGGTGTGVLWDRDIDGNIGSVETPDLEQNYQYALLYDRVSSTGQALMQVRVRRSTDDVYLGYLNMSNTVINSFVFAGIIKFEDATNNAFTHSCVASVRGFSGSTTTSSQLFHGIWNSTPSFRINRIQTRPSSGSFDAGRIILLRRRWEQPI